MHKFLGGIALLLLLASSASAAESSLHIKLPEGCTARDATASAKSLKLQNEGTVDGRTVAFNKLLPDTPYDVQIHLADGTDLRGVNMSWYNDDALKKDAGDLADADREEIAKLIVEPRAFMKSQPLFFRGDHDRCTVLIHQIRDQGFHSGGDDEVIWRMELWYYKNEHGGWMRVQAQDHNLLRTAPFTQKVRGDDKENQMAPGTGRITPHEIRSLQDRRRNNAHAPCRPTHDRTGLRPGGGAKAVC